MPSSEAPLPKWRDHPGHRKVEPLQQPGAPRPVFEEFLDGVANDLGRERSKVSVLDIGCGRGALVSRLLAEGWDAWGVDIAPEYVEAGSPYFDRLEPGRSRIRLIEDARSLPFDMKFDVIVSTETIEHVEDLDSFCAQIGSVSGSNTRGIHQWPAKWRPEESHMLLPCAHWLPKGKARRALIKAELAAGLGAPYFKDETLDRRTRIFCEYSEQETFYRSTREIRATFARHGTTAETTATVESWAARRWPRIPTPFRTGISFAYGQFKSVIMTTRYETAGPLPTAGATAGTTNDQGA